MGATGLITGIGSAVGLELKPGIFEPVLRLALFASGLFLHHRVFYASSDRTFLAVLLIILGVVWALVCGYAFVQEPARNRSIDSYLRRKDEIDRAHRATIISSDDPPV